MKYFAYGSNMLLERLKARVSSAMNPTIHVLQKHTLNFHKKSNDGSGKCNIIATASENDSVFGVLYEMDDDQIDILDNYEGVGFGYRREKINILLNGRGTSAFVYIAEQHAIDETLVPYRWYYDLVLAGAEQHSLPNDYLTRLRAVPFIQDPNPQRKTRLEALAVLKAYSVGTLGQMEFGKT